MIADDALREKVEKYKLLGYKVPQWKYVKTPEQIEGIRKAGVVNTGVLDYVASKICAGVSTQDIDDWVAEYTAAHGGICAPYHYEGYPKHVCVSIDDVVCHGIPSKKRILKEGDIVNVDCTTILDGYYADASRMFIIGETTREKEKLVRVAKQCLELGLQEVKAWGFLGDVGYAIEQHASRNGFKVVRDFGGHGAGLEFHEDPFVYHYGKRGTGCLIVPGMTFTIEPMINMKKSGVKISALDGWTVTTKDGLPSAQWEYTVAVFEDRVEILSH
ncbi:MAG: type I methionyl aminopeptidase [Erysipelotrichaceae bacterium]|nr:type I methionyl aminopeptidase [Erysipelotrichaceae bacterium]